MFQGKIPITTGLAQSGRIQVNIAVNFHPQGERFCEFENSKDRRKQMRRFQEVEYWALICTANTQHPEMLQCVQRSCPWSQR